METAQTDNSAACGQSRSTVGLGFTPLEGKYGDVLRPFLSLMEAELHANAGKGDRPGWLSMSREVGMLEIYYHTAKLQKAVKDDNTAAIREHAADVANMAMMILDVCGGLDHVTPNAELTRRAEGTSGAAKRSES